MPAHHKESTAQLSADGTAPPGLYEEPIAKFAEIYGSALVGQQRMFVVAVLSISLALGSFIMFTLASRNNVAVPWLVEIDPDRGLLSRPVRIEPVRPSDAVVKAELARWITKVFMIDRQLTQKAFIEANVMTRGLGTEQFTKFRVDQNVVERLTRDPSLQRVAIVASVDVSQRGVAFIFLKTQEAMGNNASSSTATYRATLKYEVIPPGTEAEILVNPLGLYITSMNVAEEGRSK